MPNRVPSYSRFKPDLATTRRSYDQLQRDPQSKVFYNSVQWNRIRRSKLAQDPLCEDCKARGPLVSATHVHHVREVKDRPDLVLDFENLRSLCHSCHSRLHARKEESR